uniref:RRM domain-containing protein n=1 Tax=Steinernema glaseri TaxID=37863 RepID=A0A1I7XZJ9_9BILA
MAIEYEEDRSREASLERNGRDDRSHHKHRREHRRSRSRSHDREHRHRSRSGSNRSRTYDSDDQLNNIADARLHIADLDMSVRRRDIEDLFSKYGRLEDVWLATYPPIYAFVVFSSRRDAARALKELRTCQIRHCRVRVSAALPRRRAGDRDRRPPPRSSGGYFRSAGGPPRRRSRSPQARRYGNSRRSRSPRSRSRSHSR